MVAVVAAARVAPVIDHRQQPFSRVPASISCTLSAFIQIRWNPMYCAPSMSIPQAPIIARHVSIDVRKMGDSAILDPIYQIQMSYKIGTCFVQSLRAKSEELSTFYRLYTNCVCLVLAMSCIIRAGIFAAVVTAERKNETPWCYRVWCPTEFILSTQPRSGYLLSKRFASIRGPSTTTEQLQLIWRGEIE